MERQALKKLWCIREYTITKCTIITCALIALFITNIQAQSKQDYTWIFGSNASAVPGSEGTLLSFNNDSLRTSYQQLPASIGSNNASICDENGSLLFYTNGCDIYNNNFELMENGANINPGEAHDENCEFGHYGGLQNSIILPDPTNDEGYYYYHKLMSYVWEPQFHISAYEIMYSYIDFSENPLGKVIEKNVVIDDGRRHITAYNEAIYQANGKDWWVIDFLENDSTMLVFAIDDLGIYLSHEINIPNANAFIYDCSSAGQSCFTPDGTKLLKYCSEGGLDIFDFDRETGTISNYKNVSLPSQNKVSGLAISPNSRFAYVSNFWTLYQVDLWEEELEEGVVFIDSFDLFLDPFGTNLALMQLGPDCKIYMNSTNYTRSLHVINQPDLKGINCGFKQHSFEIPDGLNPGSFPNFPYFRMDEEDICDPTISSIFNLPIFIEGNMNVYPNPSKGVFSVEFDGSKSGVIQVLDITGKRLSKHNIVHQEKFDLDLSQLQNGMYFIEFVSFDHSERTTQKIIVSK